MEIDPASVPWQTVNKLMTGSILPRPIGWISTINANGQPNLAPYSFFNMVCANPPTVVFCPMIRSTDGEHKDTLNNIKANGEFVVNFVTEDLAEAMNISSQETFPDVNEFELAGLSYGPLRSGQSPARRRKSGALRMQTDADRGNWEPTRERQRRDWRDRPFTRR